MTDQQGPVVPLGLHHVCLADPDGNDLELAWDRPWDEWPRDSEGHVQMAMDGDVDLDALVAEAA